MILRIIFYPAIALMNHLKIPQKMVILAFVFSLPLAAFMYLLISETNMKTNFVEKERLGTVYNQHLAKFFQDMQQHRGMANAFLNGDATFEENLILKQSQIEEHIEALDSVDNELGATLETRDRWSALKEKWRVLRAQIFGMKAHDGYEVHTLLIEEILALMAHVADVSNLTLDPVVESFYLMDTVVNKLPVAIEHAGKIRGLGAGAIVPKSLTAEEKAHLIVLAGLCTATMEGVQGNMRKAFHEDSDLEPRLEGDMQEAVHAMQGALEMLDRRVINARDITIEPAEYFDLFTGAINMSFRLHDSVTSSLYRILQERMENLTKKKKYIQLFAILSLAVLFYLFVGNYFSIMNSLTKLMHASRQIGGGDMHVNVVLEAKDELESVAECFNDMAQNLARYTAAIIATNEALEGEIVERKKAEDKLEEAMAELRRSNAQLEEFAYMASHDLKEPLVTVGADLKLLQRRIRGKHDPEADTFISEALDGVMRMERLISDLLEYSRVGITEKPLEMTDCSGVVALSLTNLKAAIKTSGANITLDPLPEIMADPKLLVQLFQNLVNNAIQYRSMDPPHIHISAVHKEREWVFSVSDNGMGIPREHAGKIFEIFHRLNSNNCTGTGIGLATCKKIMERHSGKIWVESESGKGSTFYFMIPDRKSA